MAEKRIKTAGWNKISIERFNIIGSIISKNYKKIELFAMQKDVNLLFAPK